LFLEVAWTSWTGQKPLSIDHRKQRIEKAPLGLESGAELGVANLDFLAEITSQVSFFEPIRVVLTVVGIPDAI